MIIAFLKLLAIIATFYAFTVDADEVTVLERNAASGVVVNQITLIPEEEAELHEATDVRMAVEDDESTNAPDKSASEEVNQSPQMPEETTVHNISGAYVTVEVNEEAEISNDITSEVVDQAPQMAVEPEIDETIKAHAPVTLDKDRETSQNINSEIVNSASPMHEKTDAHDSPSRLLYIVLFIMSLVTLVSTIISFYLYKWRRILLTQPNLLVPEEWGKYLDVVGKNMTKLEASVANNIGHIASSTSESTNKVDNMIETYMSLQGALDQKDSEIRRLKTGYDAEIFRKYLSRFIRIELALDDYIYLKEGDKKILVQLKRLFEDAFDECGVESFGPQVGEDYRRAFGVADNPKKTISDDPDKEFTIDEILESGYRLRNGNDYEIIKPAKVSIYKYCKQGEI